jgi:hypothetical protein
VTIPGSSEVKLWLAAYPRRLATVHHAAQCWATPYSLTDALSRRLVQLVSGRVLILIIRFLLSEVVFLKRLGDIPWCRVTHRGLRDQARSGFSQNNFVVFAVITIREPFLAPPK